MGLLDDAIREHLELKRRRGADESEVSRQESEALGAPQQRAEFAEAEPAAPAVSESAPPPAEDAPLEPAAVEPAPDEGPPPIDEPPPEPAEPPEEPEGRRDQPEPDEIPLDQHTVEYTPEPPPPEARPEGEDVLEETPEFLQETPEHDRLWFEQKPPRDFDLDR